MSKSTEAQTVEPSQDAVMGPVPRPGIETPESPAVEQPADSEIHQESPAAFPVEDEPDHRSPQPPVGDGGLPIGNVDMTRIVPVLAAFLVLVGGGFLVSRLFGGGDAYDTVVLYEEGSGDVFLTTAGGPANRQNRIGEDTQPAVISWIENGQFMSGWSAPYDGKHLVVLNDEDGSRLNLVASDGSDSETVFDTPGEIEAFVREGQVMIQEDRGGGQRCHSGPIGEIERVYRGDSCSFTARGWALGWQRSGEEFDVAVVDESGSELFVDEFTSAPTLTQDGSMLVDKGGSRNFRLIDVTSGEVLVDVDAELGADYAIGPDEFLATVANDDGELTLELHSDSGDRIELDVVDSSDHELQGWFMKNGDFIWTVKNLGNSDVRVERWNHGSGEVENVGEGQLADIIEFGDDVVVAWADDLGLELERAEPGGTVEAFWDIDVDDISDVGLRLLDNDRVVVVYNGDDSGFGVINVESGTSEWMESNWDKAAFAMDWDALSGVGAAGDLVVATDNEVDALYQIGRDGATELTEADDILLSNIVGEGVQTVANDRGEVVSYYFDLNDPAAWPTATHDGLSGFSPFAVPLEENELVSWGKFRVISD